MECDPLIEEIVELARKRWPQRICRVKRRHTHHVAEFELWTEGWAFEQVELTAPTLAVLRDKLWTTLR